MLKRLLVVLIASAFAMGAYAQAPKAEPKTDAKTEAKKDGTKKAKKSSKAKPADAKAKDAPKKDTK